MAIEDLFEDPFHRGVCWVAKDARGRKGVCRLGHLTAEDQARVTAFALTQLLLAGMPFLEFAPLSPAWLCSAEEMMEYLRRESCRLDRVGRLKPHLRFGPRRRGGPRLVEENPA